MITGHRPPRVLAGLVATALALFSGLALAAAGGGGGLAWEAPLTTITNSFTGPVAFAASSIAVVTTLATLAFADNLSGAGRTLVYMVLIIAALIGVVNLLQTLFQGGAAATASPALALWALAAAVLALGGALAWLEVRAVTAWRRRRARRVGVTVAADGAAAPAVAR